MEVLDRHGLLVTRFVADVTDAEIAACLEMLAVLKVRSDDWSPLAKYDRAALRISWARLPGLGIDTKDLTLARAMERDTVVFDSDGFTLKHGEMADPYTGNRVVFEQLSDAKGRIVELDHVVSLSDAFTSGGYRWKAAGTNWQKLANDPMNLLAVSSSANRSKGDRNAASWLPPVQEFQKRYVILQIQVKTRYHLSVTVSELAAMRQLLTR